MEFSFSQLLILLFLLLPFIERFFGKKKTGQTPAEEQMESQPEYYDDEPTTEMTWEETLAQMESVIKGETPRLNPAPMPARMGREFVKNEFKSTKPHFRSESLLDTPLVSVAEDLEVRTPHVRVTRQSLREAIVINEILAPPVSRRAHGLNRVP
jgi:hypothetical protein